MKNILIVVDIQNGFNRYEQTHILADKIVKLTNSGIFDRYKLKITGYKH